MINPKQRNSKANIPERIIVVLRIIPIILEIKPIMTKEARSSKLKVSPRSSVILFQGAKKDRMSWGSEKKFTVNQKKFFQT
jgi:hypothetical protein